jgi:glycosyltransferase involved in cell wall biosynthesis/SAM-dependent methyltransferase
LTPEIHFAYPGDIQTLTGGYGYDRQLIAGLQRLGLPVHLLPLPAGFPAPDTAELDRAEALFAALPDSALVIADGLAFGMMDQTARRHGPRLKIIALCHHPLALESGLPAAEADRRRRSEQQALAAATAVIVTSQATASLLGEQFAIAPERITVAPPGTDRKPFAPCRGDPPVLLCVATLTPRKGHDVLIRALAAIRHLPWSLRLVGGSRFDPDWARHLRQLTRNLGLDQRIHFLGELARLDEEYAHADVFVLPSRFEGYGMAFAEALSFGLPVLAAKAGAVPDLVPATAGLLVDPDDEQALSRALTALLQDHGLRQQLQLGARQAALHLPTWEQCAETVAALLRKHWDQPAPTPIAEGFSTAWLDLRENADLAARDKILVARAARWLDHSGDGSPRIVDLGAGTGSTLRAFTALGTTHCLWRLVDHDVALLNEAGRRHGQLSGFEQQRADLRDVDSLPLNDARLVTASALFDLVSREVVEKLADRLQTLSVGFYAALNYNGITRWDPPHPLDEAVLAAFNLDQKRDKGLGPALGPDSTCCLQTELEKRGFTVVTADSPWLLGPEHSALLSALITGISAAVSYGYGLAAADLQQWRSFRLAHAATGSCCVGHTDILALPAASSGP